MTTGSLQCREAFTSKFGLLMTMIGVAVGLGNVWRFPYMVGLFGGASFVLLYLIMVVFIGIPALMAEWTLGRHTRRGTLGAFEKGGLPGGKYVGYFFVFVVFCATAYYSNTLGWVAFHGLGQAASLAGLDIDAAAILPPDSDTVVVHYTGALIDGRVFDSSVQRGEPATFPVDRVISGWTEALQLMTVGSKYQLFIPPDLAYGAEGTGGPIGPNETLVFEVELLEIAGG